MGETLTDGNESDLEKRNEGRKAETKTSDKENESVQRKWPRGAAPTEESPPAWCFLSSQRRKAEQLTNCPEPPPSPPHLLTSGQRWPRGFGKEGFLPPERSLRAINPKHQAGGWVDHFLLGASGILIRLHWASVSSL